MNGSWFVDDGGAQIRLLKEYNMREFVRISTNGDSMIGTALEGSRASYKEPWHSWVDLNFAGGLWFANGKGEIKLGARDLETPP